MGGSVRVSSLMCYRGKVAEGGGFKPPKGANPCWFSSSIRSYYLVLSCSVASGKCRVSGHLFGIWYCLMLSSCENYVCKMKGDLAPPPRGAVAWWYLVSDNYKQTGLHWPEKTRSIAKPAKQKKEFGGPIGWLSDQFSPTGPGLWGDPT